MMKRRGYTIVSYLDDFLVIAQTEQECLDALNTLLTLLRALGFSIAWDKTEGPTTSIVFLGVQINTKQMSLHLPTEKVQQLQATLTSFQQKRRASCRQLQQLAGKLTWASHVISGGRVYQQRVFDLLRPLRKQHHKTQLSPEFQADVKWWLDALRVFNTKYILQHHADIIPLYTDACTAGAGMLAPFDWAHVDWSIDIPGLAPEHINVKETMAVILAIYRWAPLLQNAKVIVYTDNVTTRANINKGACKNPLLMGHLRQLFWLSVVFNFELTCVHIPGNTNVYADAISRLRSKGHLLHWYSVCTGGAPLNITNSLQLTPHMSHTVYNSIVLPQVQRICNSWMPVSPTTNQEPMPTTQREPTTPIFSAT